MPPEKERADAVTQLRARIARIDRALVRAYAERCTAVRELHRVKEQLGMPRYDASQEAKVLARARRWAVADGLDQGRAEELLRTILAGRDPAPAPELPARPEAGRASAAP